MKSSFYPFVYIFGFFIFSGCNKPNSYTDSYGAVVVKEWKFTLSSSNENHVNAGGETVAGFHMLALSDNSLRFDIEPDSAVDEILGVQINLGDPLTDGALLLDLPIRPSAHYVTSTVTNLRKSLVDTLLNDNIEKYINVTSRNVPSGLVRGQLNSTIVFAKNVQLSGSEVVPSVKTNSAGVAYIRLTSNMILYSKVNVNNVEAADPVTNATINLGFKGTNRLVFLNLVSTPAEFGVAKKSAMIANDYVTLLNNDTYISVSSTLNATGILRGQLK